MWFLWTAALASPVEIGLASTTQMNDPYTTHSGLEASIGVNLHDRLAIEMSGAWVPSRRRSRLLESLLLARRVSPDITQAPISGTAALALTIGRGELCWHAKHCARLDLDLLVGVGPVRTREDLEALQADGDLSHPAHLTANQTHFSHSFGARTAAQLTPALALILSSTHRGYIEVVSGETLEMKRSHWLSAGLRVRLPQRRRCYS